LKIQIWYVYIYIYTWQHWCQPTQISTSKAAKSYILNYVWTATNIIIEGGRLCTVGLLSTLNVRK